MPLVLLFLAYLLLFTKYLYHETAPGNEQHTQMAKVGKKKKSRNEVAAGASWIYNSASVFHDASMFFIFYFWSRPSSCHPLFAIVYPSCLVVRARERKKKRDLSRAARTLIYKTIKKILTLSIHLHRITSIQGAHRVFPLLTRHLGRFVRCGCAVKSKRWAPGMQTTTKKPRDVILNVSQSGQVCYALTKEKKDTIPSI